MTHVQTLEYLLAVLERQRKASTLAAPSPEIASKYELLFRERIRLARDFFPIAYALDATPDQKPESAT